MVVVLKNWFYAGSCIGPLVVIRERNYNIRLLNHEMIHAAQQKECLYIFAFIIYWVEFLVKLLYYRNIKKAYEEVSFEREAKIFEPIVGYISRRKRFTFAKYIYWNPKMLLTIDFDSPQENFDTLYASPVGTVVKYTKKIGTLLTAIETKKPITLTTFKVVTVSPGTSAFTLYGANHFVVTEVVQAP